MPETFLNRLLSVLKDMESVLKDILEALAAVQTKVLTLVRDGVAKDSSAVAIRICTASCLALPAAYYVYFRRAVSKASASILPNFPFQFPLGHMHHWVDLLEVNRTINADEKKQQQEGRPLVWSQFMLHRECYIIVKAEHICEVFANSVSRAIHPPILNAIGMFHLRKFMGPKFVGIAEGQSWHAMRKSVGKFTLSTESLKAAFSPMSAVSSDLLRWLDERIVEGNGKAVLDFHTPLHGFTLDAVALATFGARLGALEALRTCGSVPVVEAFEFAQDEMTRRLGSMNPLDWTYVGLTARARKLKEAHKMMRQKTVELIDNTLALPKANIARSITEAMSEDSDGKQAVIDNAIGMLWAGHDTTAAALSFTLAELAAQPSLQQRFHDELKSVNVTDSFPAAHKGYPLLDAMANEALRLHPPAIWTNRSLETDLVLDGITMRKGTAVFVPIWAAHRSPHNFGSDADKFSPERWLNPSAAMKNALIPFGGGNRICPGNRFAQLEFKLMLAKLVLRYEFSLPGHCYPQAKAVNNGMFQQCKDNYLSITRRPE